MLALPVLHHAQRLQRAHNVVRVDGHLLGQVLDVQMGASAGAQVVQEDVLPVGPIRNQSQIGQWLLRRSNFTLHTGQ